MGGWNLSTTKRSNQESVAAHTAVFRKFERVRADLCHLVSLNRADVWITKVTAAHWVEITDLEYVDGSSWHASKTSLCHAKLSGFKLVDLTVQ